jgi:hypothetical protein
VLHPDVELRQVSEDIGLGVFATRPIPRGTLIWVVCERERTYSPEQVAALTDEDRDALERHGYIDAAGDYVLCCDLGRYVNHACAPTTLPLGSEVEIAVRDVAVGDHITCEYGTCNLSSALRCRCGLPDCRGLVRGDDLLRYSPAWDRLIREAVERAGGVPQPLLRHARDRANLQRIIDRIVPVPSVLVCHYPDVEHTTVAESAPGAPLWRLRQAEGTR